MICRSLPRFTKPEKSKRIINPTLGLKDHDPRPGKREAAAQKLTRPFAMQPSQPAARLVKKQRGNPGGTQSWLVNAGWFLKIS